MQKNFHFSSSGFRDMRPNSLAWGPPEIAKVITIHTWLSISFSNIVSPNKTTNQSNYEHFTV